jgi:hypothetical protein
VLRFPAGDIDIASRVLPTEPPLGLPQFRYIGISSALATAIHCHPAWPYLLFQTLIQTCPDPLALRGEEAAFDSFSNRGSQVAGAAPDPLACRPNACTDRASRGIEGAVDECEDQLCSKWDLYVAKQDDMNGVDKEVKTKCKSLGGLEDISLFQTTGHSS